MLRTVGVFIGLALIGVVGPAAAELSGFPVPLGGDCFGSPVVADLNADGKPEVAVAVDVPNAGGAVHLVNAWGQPLPGWPARFAAGCGCVRLAAGRLLAGSKRSQLAFGTSDGNLHLLTDQGAEAPGFPREIGGSYARCEIATLVPGGSPVLVAASSTGRLLICDGRGQLQPGWPQEIGANLGADFEVADWDADGRSELLALDQSGTLHIYRADGTVAATVPLQATGFCTGRFRTDLPGRQLLVTRQAQGEVSLCDRMGRALPGWPVKVPHAALPTAVNLTPDGPASALVVDQAQSKPERTTNTIHLFGGDGEALPGWPVTPQFVAGYALYSRPAVADVDGDGTGEIFFGHTCYAVVGLRANGTALVGFPLGNVGMVFGTPVLAHLVSDRRYDLVFADVSSIRSLHAFTLPYDSAPWQAHRPSAAETRRGYVLTSAVPFETILPDAPMVEGKLLQGLDLTACAGEYEPATFVLHARRDVTALLRPDELALDAAHKLPGSCLDVRFVHVWRQRRPDNPGDYLVPELLLKRDPGELKGLISQPLTPQATTRVPAGTARQFWVTVHVPEGTRPGTYQGRLALTVNGQTSPVPVRLQVPALKLPPDPFVHSIYFHGSSIGLGWYGEKDMSAAAWLERARKQLADLRAHGLNAAESFTPVKIITRGEGYDFDFSNLRQSLALHQAAGLKRWAVIELGYSTLDGQQLHPRLGAPFYRAFTALVGEVQKLARQEGWPPISHYGVDEPLRSTPEGEMKYYGFTDPVDVCRRWFEAIRAGGGYTTAAVYHTELGGWPILGPLCDLPIYSLGALYPGCKREDIVRETAANRTRQAWYYWQCWQERPLENRLLAGLYLCKSGLTGVMPWDYMGYSGDPYNDFDGGAKDMCLAYPSQEGPVPTLAWEAYREGVDDCRYWAAVRQRPEAQQILDDLSWSSSQNLVSLTAADFGQRRARLLALALKTAP